MMNWWGIDDELIVENVNTQNRSALRALAEESSSFSTCTEAKWGYRLYVAFFDSSHHLQWKSSESRWVYFNPNFFIVNDEKNSCLPRMTKWWSGDELIIAKWWSGDGLMMNWSCIEYESMMIWCWIDAGLVMNWLWIDDELMMKWWFDAEFVMSLWWIDDAIAMNVWWIACGLIVKWWWMCDEFMMKSWWMDD